MPLLRDHKGWYIRRVLPHLDAPETTQAITFRLADALPRTVALARKDEQDATYRARIAEALDAGQGECLLRDPAIASIVEGVLLHADGSRYELFAWVIMPNHVHVLVRQPEGGRLPDIVHAWKSWTAKQSTTIEAAREECGKASISTGTCETSVTSTKLSRTSKRIR